MQCYNMSNVNEKNHRWCDCEERVIWEDMRVNEAQEHFDGQNFYFLLGNSKLQIFGKKPLSLFNYKRMT